MTSRERVLVTQALEGLAAGDIDLVTACLLALDEEIAAIPRLRCRFCTARFDAHGAREAHELRQHPHLFDWIGEVAA